MSASSNKLRPEMPISNRISLTADDIIDHTHMPEGIVTYLKSSGIHDIQRYHAGLRRFLSNRDLTFTSGFKSSFECISESPEIENSRIWKGEWRNKRTDDTRPLRVFSKIVHLVNPILFQQRSQILSYVPAPDSNERDQLRRHAISRHNQASVDATVCYVLSRIGELGITPHSIQYLETICGIADKYNYKITDDFMSYRNQGWFWSLAEEGRELVLDGEFDENVKEWIMKRPEEKEEDTSMFDEVDTSEIGSLPNVESSTTLCNLEECDTISVENAENEEPLELMYASSNQSVKLSESDEMEEILEESKGEIYLRCSNIPVLVCFQEAAENTMDSLLAELEEKEDGLIGDFELEKKWSAWLFQIVAALNVYQKYVCFCHNDLHTNNIVYVSTEEEFLYYKNEAGDIYRVPTYGKIFKLIDFGRATCEIGNKKIMSSDFAEGEDAAGQYNWGPFYNEEEEEVAPNMSFDLCRLAISIFGSMCPDEDDRAESDLAELLWAWMTDDMGDSVLYTEEGDERFEGFDLYVHIAAHIHSAVPADQFSKKPFRQFKWKGKAARAAAARADFKAYPIFCGSDEELDI